LSISCCLHYKQVNLIGPTFELTPGSCYHLPTCAVHLLLFVKTSVTFHLNQVHINTYEVFYQPQLLSDQVSSSVTQLC